MKKNSLKVKKIFKMKKSEIDIQQPGNDFFFLMFFPPRNLNFKL